MMDDEDLSAAPPVDLSRLDPLADARRFDVMAQRIVRDGMAARSAAPSTYRQPRSAVADIGRWSLPILAAAALVVAAAIPTLAVSARRLSSANDIPVAQSDRLGFPAPVIALTQAGRQPTPADVIAAFDARWLEVSR